MGAALSAKVDGDANKDGRVDETDLNILSLKWQQSATEWGEANFNEDIFVDADDLNALALSWQVGVEQPASISIENSFAAALTASVVVPEPATAVTTLGALTMVSAVRRRRA